MEDKNNMENQETKVCFICGTHTTLIINIYEPRCGPNMIDVISEKFKMQPLNDDKFLCYTCNNWLINWYSMQKKSTTAATTTTTTSTTEDTSSHEDANSAAIAANAHKKATTKTSDDIQPCIDTNELVVISDDEDNENVDVNNIVQTLRNRLKKYLYYPNRQKSGEVPNEWYAPHAHRHTTTLIEIDDTTSSPSPSSLSSLNPQRTCECCGKLLRKLSPTRSRQRVFCRSCRFVMRRYGNCSSTMKWRTKQHQQKNHHKRSQYHRHTTLPLIEKRSNAFTVNNHINIFEKLHQLGTTIYYENECPADEHRQHHEKPHRHMTTTMTSIPHVMDTKTQHNNQTNAWKRRAIDSNEILMTFNTVVTEVFPIDELYGKYIAEPDDQISNKQSTADNVSGHLNIQEILRNVPKSLTITIA